MKKLNKKLTLNKQTIARLNDDSQNSIYGGVPLTESCVTCNGAETCIYFNSCNHATTCANSYTVVCEPAISDKCDTKSIHCVI